MIHDVPEGWTHPTKSLGRGTRWDAYRIGLGDEADTGPGGMVGEEERPPDFPEPASWALGVQ